MVALRRLSLFVSPEDDAQRQRVGLRAAHAVAEGEDEAEEAEDEKGLYEEPAFHQLVYLLHRLLAYRASAGRSSGHASPYQYLADALRAQIKTCRDLP